MSTVFASSLRMTGGEQQRTGFAAASRALAQGCNIAARTARRPDAAAIARFCAAAQSADRLAEEAEAAIDGVPGAVLAGLIDRLGLPRRLVCGCDTSGMCDPAAGPAPTDRAATAGVGCTDLLELAG